MLTVTMLTIVIIVFVVASIWTGSDAKDEQQKKEITPTQTEEVNRKYLIEGVVEVTMGSEYYQNDGYDELKDTEKGERFCSYEVGRSFIIKNISTGPLSLSKKNFNIRGNDVKFELIDQVVSETKMSQAFLGDVLVNDEVIIIEQNQTKTVNIIGRLDIVGGPVNRNASEEENGYKLSFIMSVDDEELDISGSKSEWINCNKIVNSTKEG